MKLWKKDLPVKSAAFSRNGQILAVSDGNTIQLINAMLGAPAYPEDLVKPDGGHLLSDIEIIHFNCDLMHVLSCCGYTEAYHWNLAKPKCDPIPTQLTLKKHPLEKFQNRFSFSPNQQLAVWWRFSDKLSTEFVEFCCATVVATQSDIKFSEKWSLSAEPFLIVSFSSDSSKILTCSSKKITAFKTTDGSTVWARSSEEGLTFKSALFSWDTSTTIAHLSNGKLVVYRNSSQSDNTNSKTIPLSESVSRIALLSKKFEKLLVLSIDSERVNLYLLKEAIKISQSNEEKNSDIVRHIAYTEVISTQSTTNKAFADGAILMVSDSKIQIKDFRTGRNIKSITIAEIDSNIENSGLQDYLTFASFVGKSNEFLVCKTKMGNVIGYSASEKSFGKEIFKTKFPENAALLKVVTSYMHNIVVISSSSKIVGLDISKKGKLVWEIQNNVEEQSSPVVTTEPLSNWLLVAFAKSGKIQICDLSTGEVLQVLSNDIFKSMPIRGTLLGCAVSPCRSEVILSDNLGTCYILTLNPPGKGRTFSLTGIEGGVKDVSTVTVLGWCYYPMVKQQSRIVLGLCSDGFIRAWDLKEQQPKIKASMKVCALDGSLESLYLNVARKCEKLKSLLDTEGLCIVAGNGSGIFTELTLKQ
ncbi:hypothetical protein HK098_007241 [Nowakowskiella sp. JEL0407]|nr:hypothetical protein HK098_007241 [Nowakowskiella sp. JEL0407]